MLRNDGLHNLRDENQAGFSLVEMAMVLLIIGLLMVPIFQGMRISQKTQEAQNLEEAIQNISETITLYVAANVNRAYPCPADPTLGPGDANYGVEDCAGAAANSWAGASVPGVDFDGAGGADDLDGVGGADNVFVGAVPFQTINTLLSQANLSRSIPGASTIDPYGMKFTYAVSEALTTVAPAGNANPNFGTIQVEIYRAAGIPRRQVDLIPFGCTVGTDCINDANGDGLVDTGLLHAVVLSHGEDRKGAWAEEGGARNACPVGSGIDIENCDNDATFALSAPNLATGGRYFDDMLLSKTWEYANLWDTPSGGGNTGSLINTNSGNVGIGTDTPQERLEIIGGIQAPELRGELICFDNAGTEECFDIAGFVGNYGVEGMSCPGADEVMTGIINGVPRCVSAQLSAASLTGNLCTNPTDIIYGIDSDGNLLCDDPTTPSR